MKILRISGVVLAVAACAFGVVALAVWAVHPFLQIPVDDEIFTSMNSIDGKYIVTGFYRDVGATAKTATIVSIRATGTPFDADGDERIIVLNGKFSLSISWSSPTNVTIVSDGVLKSADVVT